MFQDGSDVTLSPARSHSKLVANPLKPGTVTLRKQTSKQPKPCEKTYKANLAAEGFYMQISKTVQDNHILNETDPTANTEPSARLGHLADGLAPGIQPPFESRCQIRIFQK